MVQLYQYQGKVLDRDECINMDEAIKRSCSLLGDQIVEFFLGNNTVAISVGPLDHFLKDVVVSEFSQILGDLSKVLEGDESCFSKGVPVF